MPRNPIKPSILAIIKASPLGLSEYELIQRLRESDADRFVDESPRLALFHRHFLVMNALYELQDELLQGGEYLNITPLDIRLEPVAASGHGAMPTSNAVAPLREFYLDWRNFSLTIEDVEAMLHRFEERYLAIDERLDALRTLALPAGAPWTTVKQTYRRLVAQCHPDKGGDPARFRAIRRAYETLLRCYAN